MAYKLSLNTSTIRPQPLLEKIRLVGEAGFDAVELWINDIYDFVGKGGEVSAVERALKDHGLSVPCTIAMRDWGEASEKEYPIKLDECRRRMELAGRIGSPYIVATPPREPADLGRITERYADLLKIGREVGVTPLMEYISFFHSVYRLDQAWEVVKGTGDADAKLVVDAFHTWNTGGEPEALREIPAERIGHYHFDDGHPTKPRGEQIDPDRVMPGDGAIDLEKEVAILREIGYSGVVSLELFSEELRQRDPKEVVALCLERMRRYFGE